MYGNVIIIVGLILFSCAQKKNEVDSDNNRIYDVDNVDGNFLEWNNYALVCNNPDTYNPEKGNYYLIHKITNGEISGKYLKYNIEDFDE